MKTLVTGANGFVGSRLCEELARRSIPFVGTTRSRHDRRISVGELDAHTDWSRALDGVTTVVHLAARVHVMQETEPDPAAAFRRANVDGTINLARQAIAAGAKRFVFVSSIKVNGEATDGRPFSAEDEPAPEDAYGQSKQLAEAELLKLSAETGLEVVIVRPPLVYGPGVKANFLQLIRAIDKQWPLPLLGIDNLRSMVSLDNLVDFLITASTHPRAAGQIFLISDGRDLGTATLARMLAQALGKKPRLLYVPVPVLRLIGTLTGKSATISRLISSLQVDSAPARERLGWSPPVSVEEGIAQTVSSYVAAKKIV